MASAFFEGKVAVADFRKVLGTNGAKSTLNEQRFDVDSSLADSGGFLLSGAFIILRRKLGPGAS